MAQTEKYMILEKKEMFRQKIRANEAMLAAVLGRQELSPMGRPEDPVYEPFPYTADEATAIALENSSELKSIKKMIEAAGYKVAMAEKEYYPTLQSQRVIQNAGVTTWTCTAQPLPSISLFFANQN